MLGKVDERDCGATEAAGSSGAREHVLPPRARQFSASALMMMAGQAPRTRSRPRFEPLDPRSIPTSRWR